MQEIVSSNEEIFNPLFLFMNLILWCIFDVL